MTVKYSTRLVVTSR